MLQIGNEQLCSIHGASMELLQRTGMRFMHPKAIEVFKAHGLRVEGDVVYFTEAQLMEHVKKAPAIAV